MLILNLPSLLQNQNLEIIQTCTVVLYSPHDNIVWIHSCDECKKSTGWAFVTSSVHFVIARASFFRGHERSGLPIRAKYSYFRTICEHTFDNSPTDPISSSLHWWSSIHGVATACNCWVVSFASSQYLSTHFFSMTFHVVGPWQNVCFRVLRIMKMFCTSSWHPGFKHSPVIDRNIFAYFAFSLSAT